MIEKSFSFIYKDRTYDIDNNNFYYKENRDKYFLTRKCPKCKKYQYYSETTCPNCHTDLSNRPYIMAFYSKKRMKGIFIGALLWSIVDVLFSTFSGKTFGAIPTVIGYGVCMSIGSAVSGTKMQVDDEATEELRAYLKEKEEKERASIPQSMTFDLSVKCPLCGQMTESGSKFCSNCGNLIG